MKKIWCLTIILFVLLLVLVLVPGSPVFNPLVNHAQQRAEDNWDCKIAIRRSSVNLLKSTLTLNDLRAQTQENANPNWHLEVKTSVIRVDYRSLMQRELILSLLFLDQIRFIQLERDTSQDIAQKKDTSKKPAGAEHKAGGEKKKGNEGVKGVNIKRLIVTRGYFEYRFLHQSGRKDVFEVENVNLDSDNLFFHGKPSQFFKSILIPNTSLN